ncbi:MAG TPA: peptidoglycan DD-metalloendopeptidase family protein [Pseudomonadales bacterium]
MAAHLRRRCAGCWPLLLGWAVGAALAGSAVAAESVPGGLHLHPLPDGVRAVRYQDQPVLIFTEVAVVGINLDAKPGAHVLTIEYEDGRTESRHFTVADKRYTEQHLTIANPRMVNPLAEDLERIGRESALMAAQYRLFTEPPGSPLPFVQPVDGPLSSSFGRRRVLNGERRSAHSGLDIAVNTGTPVESPAPGKVTLTGDFYFNGNTVFVDHGFGLISMMCHLSRIDVATGENVQRGHTLGLVGATGRVTGPHLHWSVSMNGNRVDPVQVMAVFREPPAAP